ncbi:MAG: hypothetical protein HYU36_22275 [Planctomycetes bacterium]|nr:hypothetical protein [Planctomycetota bacterium]
MLKYFCLVLSVSVLAGCSGTDESSLPPLHDIRFLPGGLRLEWAREFALAELGIRDSRGHLLVRWPVGGVSLRSQQVVLNWQEDEEYEVWATDARGRSTSTMARAPHRRERFLLSFQVPTGREITEGDDSPIQIPFGADFDATILVENLSRHLTVFSLQLECSPGIERRTLDAPAAEPPSRPESPTRPQEPSPVVTRFEGSLEVNLERWHRQIKFRIPEGAAALQALRVIGRICSSGQTPIEVRREARILPVPLSRLREGVALGDVLLPADERGRPDPRRRPDTLTLPDPVSRALRRLLQIPDPVIDYYSPAAYQAIPVTNRSSDTLSVLVSSEVRAPGGSRPIAALSPPEDRSASGRAAAVLADLRPGETASVILPVHVNPVLALPGCYVRRLEVRPLGMDSVMALKELPLEVRTPDFRAFLVSLVAAVVTAVVSLAALVLHRQLFRQFSVRALVLIALFGSTAFAVINLPSTLLFSLVYAVLGPFAFLVTGLLDQLVFSLLLVTLVILVPRPGTVGLALALRQLLAAVVFGNFYLPTLLFTGTTIGFLEAALWLSGATRSPRRIDRYPAAPVRTALAVGLALGIGHALAALVHYQLQIALYRFYLADWYIGLSVAVHGFLYSFLGAVWGLRFGWQLRKISTS